jgi:integrase
MASLCKKRGVPRWRGCVMVGGVSRIHWTADGSRKSEVEALLWEDETRKKLQQDAAEAKAAPTATASPRLIDWLNAHLDRVGKTRAEKTYVEKAGCYRRFVWFFEPDSPADGHQPRTTLGDVLFERGEFTLARLEEYFDEQAAARSGNAANKDRKNLAEAWNKAAGRVVGFPSHLVNPFRLIERYPEKRSPRYVPQLADFWAVYDEAGKTGGITGLQDQVMLLTMLHTAARKGEVFWGGADKPGLTLEDLDFGRGTIRLWTRKRNGGDLEPDELPMTDELQRGIRAWLEARPEQEAATVFYCVERTPFCMDYYGKPFLKRTQFMRRVCDRAGVRRFGFHSIRHLTARHLHEQGYGVEFIQRVLRHTSPEITRRYLAKLGVEGLRAGFDKSMPRRATVIQFPKPQQKTPGDCSSEGPFVPGACARDQR